MTSSSAHDASKDSRSQNSPDLMGPPPPTPPTSPPPPPARFPVSKTDKKKIMIDTVVLASLCLYLLYLYLLYLYLLYLYLLYLYFLYLCLLYLYFQIDSNLISTNGICVNPGVWRVTTPIL